MQPIELILPGDRTSSPHRFSCVAIAVATTFLTACSALVSHPKPTAGWTQRTGQVKISGADASIIGDIVIRHDADNFLAEISKGPGLPMLKLSAGFGAEPGAGRHMLVVRATGPLAGGGWTLRPKRVIGGTNPNMKIFSRPWAALPEVFQWSEWPAKGGRFEVRLPDLTTHATVANGRVQRFDYRIHANLTNRVLTSKELGKLAPRANVVCALDN